LERGVRLTYPRKLWQRNVLATVVVLAALAALVAVQIQPGWSDYRGSVTPAHVVPANRSATFDGHTWQLGGVRHFAKLPAAGATPLPDGTVLLVVTVEHAGAALEAGCTGVVTDGHRRWKAELVGGYSLRLPDGVSENCSGSGAQQFSFVLPHDAVPTAVDVVSFDTRIIVRLEL
jgi:hypothetical protein